MIVKILGSGCAKCNRLEQNVRELIEVHQLDGIQVEKVTDLTQILEYGIMMTPGLVIDNTVKSVGAIPETKKLLTWLQGS